MTFTAGAIAESPIVSEQKALQVITVKGEKGYYCCVQWFLPRCIRSSSGNSSKDD
jgi:hypothetical protein